MPRAGKRNGGQLNVFISFSWVGGFLEDAVSLSVKAYTAAALSFVVLLTNVYYRVVAS